MTESGFWVGPATDPHRFRLTHLLGSGGEGEVWRARDREGAEYAVKISAATAATDDAWETRSRAMRLIDVPGLVRVCDAFIGPERHLFGEVPSSGTTHRFVAMEFVDGLTLGQWLDEHPDASPRVRVGLLRKVARTIDALHAGPGGHEPLTHGDIKPSNVIVGPEGTPVLVDVGLLRPLGDEPASGRSSAYSPPELRSAGGRATRQSDTFAFAVTAVETITGTQPPLDPEGFLDTAAMRAVVKRDRTLRFRPVLRRQLVRALATSPAQRPARTSAFFTAGRRVLVTATVVIVTISGGSAVALHRSPQVDAASAPRVVPTPSRSPSVLVDPPKAPSGQGPEAIAVPPASPTPSATPTPSGPPTRTLPDTNLLTVMPDHESTKENPGLSTRESLLASVRGPGPSRVRANSTDAWGPSGWSLDLSSHQELHVTEVTFRRDSIAPPRDGVAIAYDVGDRPVVIAPNAPGHTSKPSEFKSSATYAWDMASSTPARETDHDPRTLAVFPKSPGNVYLNSTACSGNYEFWVTVSFTVAGSPDVVYRHKAGPFVQYATAVRMPFVTSLLGNNNFLTNSLSYVSGHPDGCRGPHAKAYESSARGTAELLVKYSASLATKNPSLSHDQVLEQVADAVAPAYSPAALAGLCDRAAAERWRYRCWPATAGSTTSGDPSPTDAGPAQVVP